MKNTPRYGAQLERKAFYAKIDRERTKQEARIDALRVKGAPKSQIAEAGAALKVLGELRWFASWRQYRIRERENGL